MNEMMVEPDVPNICSLQTPLPPAPSLLLAAPTPALSSEPTHHPLAGLNSCCEVFAVLLKIPNCGSPVSQGRRGKTKTDP